MKKNLYIPESLQLPSEENLWQWYLNVSIELNSNYLSDIENEYMASYYNEAGLLRTWRRPFFRYHYVNSFAIIAQYYFPKKNLRILDLGCGMGTQALYFAMMGAEVIAVDLDTLALSIFTKRIKYYEDLSGKKLNIKLYNVNAFEFDYQVIGKFQGIWSMFAFNMMQPSLKLIDLILSNLSNEGAISLLDNNRISWANSIILHRRRKVLSPIELENELKKKGFKIRYHKGGVSLLPILWFLLPYSFAEKLDKLFDRNWFFPISHLLIASK